LFRSIAVSQHTTINLSLLVLHYNLKNADGNAILLSEIQEV